MKKWILPIAVLLLIGANFCLSTKFHYPDLPFPNKTKQEVAKLASNSSLPLSKVTQQDGYVWFVTDDAEDIAIESLKHRLSKNGWEFSMPSDSGFYFEKNNEKVHIQYHKWTNNYLLFQLPMGL